jgi:predicted transposase/invertase (TIGR01784 family)
MTKNMDVFKKFLIITLDLDESIRNSKLEFMDKEFPKEMDKEKGKTVDINVRINNKVIIDVEMNSYDFNNVKLRNDRYLDKLSTTILETGEDYDKYKNIFIYQLNLNLIDNYKNVGENIIVSYDITSNSIYINNKKVYLKHLAYYKELYYNNYRNLKYDELILVALTATKFTELNEILSKALTVKQKNRFLESVINMSLNEFRLHEWEKDKWDAIVEQIGQERAFNNGIQQGIQQGIQEGINKNTTSMIKSMLSKKMSYKDISDISCKSIDEIKEIEKSMKLD